MQLLTMVLDSLGIVLIRSLKRPNTLRIEVNYSMINSPRKLPVQIPRLTAQIYIYMYSSSHFTTGELPKSSPNGMCRQKFNNYSWSVGRWPKPVLIGRRPNRAACTACAASPQPGWVTAAASPFARGAPGHLRSSTEESA